MIIDCISDLHGYFPNMEGGDLLIIAGDLTEQDTTRDLELFSHWLDRQDYEKKVFIGGNHDNLLSKICSYEAKEVVYLFDDGTDFCGLKIWGSPWVKSFHGMNPRCKAFTVGTEEGLASSWDRIPEETDILITHCAPFGIFDKNGRGDHVGSPSLRNAVLNRIKPLLHVFGNIHEWGGSRSDLISSIFVNSSHVNGDYEPVNKPVRILL